MNEKKILKMDDEAMQNVTGGQEDKVPAYTPDIMPPIDYNEKFEDPNLIYLTCPECGGDLGISTYKGSGYISTVTGVCHHCNKPFSITL